MLIKYNSAAWGDVLQNDSGRRFHVAGPTYSKASRSELNGTQLRENVVGCLT